MSAHLDEPLVTWDQKPLSLYPVLRMGHPDLLKRTLDVKNVLDPEIQFYCRLLQYHCEQFNAAGIAAPQIGIRERIFAFRAPADHPDGGEEVPLTIAINPKIIWSSEKLVKRWEACLSIPDLICEVERPAHIRYAFTTPTNERIEREATGFHAKVVQHELDHLNGILSLHRVSDPTRVGYIDEMKKFTIGR